MPLHVFVAMPYGTKEGINFNKVYDDYIKPALEGEGYEVFRADEELRAGNIRSDMFQELLLADLVVADLSIDNPNVWYELGIRHALRARGVILIQCQREKQPFDVYTDRKLRYHMKDGIPDPAFLEADKKALAEMAKATMAAWHGRKISPVYHHLRYLHEPTWKNLRVEEAKEFWEKYENWEFRIEVARKKNRPGDILVLADEAPVQALKLEEYRRAGKALVKLGHFSFALEQYEKALKINPEDLESCQQKGILLGRLKRHHEATVWLKKLIRNHPEDSETLALLGRVEKDAWVDSWRKGGKSSNEMRIDASFEVGLLRESIKYYVEGFKKNPCHYYSGINALTLLYLHRHLTGEEEGAGVIRELEGGLRWSITSALEKETLEKKDFWARVTLGDLEILSRDAKTIERAYRNAVAISENDWFALNSSRQQLQILQDLEFRPEQVSAVLEIFDHVLTKLKSPWEPRKVFLFSGHMIDAPNRAEPRFPADKEIIAETAIKEKLDALGACAQDLALCGGACGGDLLFAEACLGRGLHLELRIPFEVPRFLEESVAFAGDVWRDRFFAAEGHENTDRFIMPDELGPTPKKGNPFERNNLWQLYTALSWGAEKVHFICLWNRKGADGPGGTRHMHDEVKKRSGQVHVLDTSALW